MGEPDDAPRGPGLHVHVPVQAIWVTPVGTCNKYPRYHCKDRRFNNPKVHCVANCKKPCKVHVYHSSKRLCEDHARRNSVDSCWVSDEHTKDECENNHGSKAVWKPTTGDLPDWITRTQTDNTSMADSIRSRLLKEETLRRVESNGTYENDSVRDFVKTNTLEFLNLESFFRPV